ncbi:alcohol dehydrogenase [Alteromonas sp. H39]|uniref:alcohol dehydrogenase n=1 Tax=Alteromonas sp. H39 TaxID=3389876 RepID=UPI0039E15505
MYSQQFSEYGEALKKQDYETPRPTGKAVVVKVEACGVCHSDLHVWDGHFDMGGDNKMDIRAIRELPFTLGHEIAGEVVAVGEDVTDVKPGQKHVIYPWIGCGHCQLCDSGFEHICNQPRSLGFAVDGGFSTHVIVPDEKYLLPLGDLPASLACTYACSGVTAYSAISQIQAASKNGAVLIVGAGGVGLSALAMAKSLIDAHIIVADIDPQKRELALEEGADEVFDPADSDAFKALMKSTNGGVAAAVDFVGSDKTALLATRLLRKGGIAIIVGLFGGAMQIPVPILPIKAITIKGSFVGSLEDMKALMSLVHEGKVKPIRITEKPLCCANETLSAMKQGQITGRVVLRPDQDSEDTQA